MANELYSTAKQKFLQGTIDMEDDDIKVILIDTSDYTVDIDVDEFLDDIDGDAIVATSGNLSNVSVTLGVVDADDTTFTEVSGDPVDALVMYKDTGSSATSPLILYVDDAAGLPITPTGDDITIQWSSSSTKIFSL